MRKKRKVKMSAEWWRRYRLGMKRANKRRRRHVGPRYTPEDSAAQAWARELAHEAVKSSEIFPLLKPFVGLYPNGGSDGKH